ncbi:MAG: C45 family peptidase [Dongiaceae bacterium]
MSELAVVEISGPPRERGRQHGEALRPAIRALDGRWRAFVEQGTRLPADGFVERFLAETDFVPAIERWTPGLLEEVRGIAEGAGLPFPTLLAIQLMDEEWWYAQALAGHPHCSSLGRVGGGRALVAQNMDLPSWMDGAQAVLRLRGGADAPDAILLTVAGMVGLCGVNAAGLGVCVNTLAQLPHCPDGLPVAFVVRGLLARRRLAEAETFLRDVRHASGQNYVVASTEGLIDLECSAAGAVPVRPGSAPPGSAWHTNHPLAGAQPPGTDESNSGRRMRTLDRCLAAETGPWDAALARRVLADRSDAEHPVSRRLEPGAGFSTFASVVWQLAGQPTAEIAPGPPCSTPYRSLGFGPAEAPAAA